MQVNGHYIAKLDPLGLDQRPMPVELDLALYGFSDKDMDREYGPCLHSNLETASIYQGFFDCSTDCLPAYNSLHSNHLYLICYLMCSFRSLSFSPQAATLYVK